jgi:gliding motility-associated lipoprotein GldD
MRFSSKLILYVTILSAAIISCEEAVNVPKPRGYPRVILPEQAYQKFAENYCQFTFNYPKSATIEQDKLFFDEKAPSDCWFNINVKGLNATVYCSYYRLDAVNTLEKLRTDAFQLVGKHNIKADYIDEFPINKPNKVSGFIFDIQGPAACPFQFYLTDSSKHFMRGALYFNAEARPDSLKPVVDFMKKEVTEMINTFEWRG